MGVTRWAVYWLAPPPTRRYVAAGLLVLAAIVWDLRPEPTVQHPFAGGDLVAGTPLEAADLEWRRVPKGLLPDVELAGVLAVDVGGGEPLVPALAVAQAPPTGWWVLEVDVPEGARVGSAVRLALTTPGSDGALVEGIVMRGSEGGIGGAVGAVAVPESASAAVAAAARHDQLVVLVGG